MCAFWRSGCPSTRPAAKTERRWASSRPANGPESLEPSDKLVDITSGNTGIGWPPRKARGYRNQTLSAQHDRPGQNQPAQALRRRGRADRQQGVPAGERHRGDPGAHRARNPDAYFTRFSVPIRPIPQPTTQRPAPRSGRTRAARSISSSAPSGRAGRFPARAATFEGEEPTSRVAVSELCGRKSLPSPERPYAPGIEGVHKVTDVEPTHLPANFDAVWWTRRLPSPRKRLATARAIAREEGISPACPPAPAARRHRRSRSGRRTRERPSS